MLLSDYVPVDQEMKASNLARKHEEYQDIVAHYFGETSPSDTVEQLSDKIGDMSQYEIKNFKQIRIDVHRTQPEVQLFASQAVQTMMIRILFAWSMRHPASAYVQGINDLAAPILLTFLQGSFARANLSEEQLVGADPQVFRQVEADTFWCLSKLIDDIQDNYTEM